MNIAPQVQAYRADRAVTSGVDGLAGPILYLVCRLVERQAMGETGRRLVADLYDGEVVAREMLKGYEECLK